MRRAVSAAVLLQLSFLGPVAAQTVYGLFGLPSPDIGKKQIGTLDPTNGTASLIGANTSVDNDAVSVGAGITAISVAGDVFYFIGEDSGDSTSKIYTVGLDDGITAAAVALPAGYTSGTTQGLWYDETAGVLYGLFSTTGGDRELASVNPSTGAVISVQGAIAGESLTTAGGVFTGDPTGQRVFLLGTTASVGDAELFEVSTSDGSVTRHPSEDYNEGTVQGMEWDDLRSTLWMIVHLGSGRRLASYNLEEEFVELSPGEIDFGDPIATVQGLIALDDATAQLFFIGDPGSPSPDGWSIFTIDVTTGDKVTSQEISGPVAINQWAGFEIIPGPELSLTKDDGGGSAMPGDTVSYTLTAANAAGAGPAETVEIEETVPAESTFSAASSSAGWTCVPDASAGSTCTLALPDIAPGANEVRTFAVVVDASVSAGITELSNTATLRAANATSDAQGSDTTPITSAAVLSLTKDDGGGSTTPGATVSYVLTVGNTGNQDADSVVVSDMVPADTTFLAGGSSPGWSCLPDASAGSACSYSVGTLAGASQVMVTFAVEVVASVPAGTTQISNQADAAASNASLVMAADTTPVIASAVLDLTKSDGDTSTEPGAILSYELDYSNIGDEDAAGTSITEVVPAQTTFDPGSSTAGWGCVPDNNAGSTCTLDLGTLGGGSSAVATFAVIVDDPVLADTTEIANVATLEASNATLVLAGDSTPVVSSPELTLTKSDGGTATAPGATLSYVLVYANVGNENAAAVQLAETVPAQTMFAPGASSPGWNCTSEGAAGASCTYDVGGLVGGNSGLVFFALVVDDPVTAGTTEIGNTASIDASNVSEPVFDTDVTPVTADPVLTLFKNDGRVTSSPGGIVVYTLAYGNEGNEGAADVQLVEMVPDNSTFNSGSSTPGWVCVPSSPGTTCTLDVGTVPGGGGAGTAEFAVRVADPFPAGSLELRNEARVEASNTPVPATDSDTTPIEIHLDLQVTKDDGGILARPGGEIAYSILWENVGNQSANGVEISETVPANTSFDAGGSTPGWVCAPDETAGSVCTFAAGALETGGNGVATFAVTVDNPLAGGVLAIDNTVSIASDGSSGVDEDPSNDSDAVSTPIDPEPPFVLKLDLVPIIGGIPSCAQLDRPVSVLSVELADIDSGVVGADSVASYVVVSAGPDGDLDTNECGPIFGDDIEVPLAGVSVAGAATNPTATLTLTAPLQRGVHLVLVCDSIVDEAGNLLDGDGDGVAGGDFARRFRVDPENLFANAHLDDCPDAPITLSPWLDDSQPPNTVGPTLLFDFDGSSLSGAIDIHSLDGQPIEVGQCVDFAGGPRLWTKAAVKGASTQVDPIDVRLRCAFSDLPACTALQPPVILDELTVPPSGLPSWMTATGLVDVPSGATSAMCSVETGTGAGEVQLYVDELFTTTAIFADGFESGDVSAWSAAAPVP